MKDFFQKNKKLLIVVLVILFLLAIGAGVYFFILDQDLGFLRSNQESIQEENDNEGSQSQEDVPPMPDYDERSSTEAIESTYVAAKKWTDDVVLYNCTGLPTTLEFPEITYEYIGVEEGKYYRWLCTYYSKKKAQTKIFGYLGAELDDFTEALDIGEFGYLLYDDINYPTDLSSIVDSVEVYSRAVQEGLKDENYINMYLGDVMDYGFVWKVEERSKTDKNEYEIGAIQNTYIFDIYTGELETKTPEEIF